MEQAPMGRRDTRAGTLRARPGTLRARVLLRKGRGGEMSSGDWVWGRSHL